MNIEDQPREVITVESVRKEKSRLEKWDLELQRKEQRVQLELIAMAEMRDRIAALQQEVDRQKQELEKQRQAMEAQAVQEREERLDKLAKLYTDSKPKVAAQLLLDRDLETTVEILQRMNERDLIKIVEEMNKMEGTAGADRAREILELFAEKALEKRRIP
jgi:flagellar motility protein MotE (MotC chaperone)